MATRAAKGRTVASITPDRDGSRRTPLIIVGTAVALAAIIITLVVTLGSSPKPPATKAEVRAAAQANLLATTSAMATYGTTRATCTTATCAASAARTAEDSLKTAWDPFNVTASGYKPLGSTLGTYAVDFAKLLSALDSIAQATTMAQIEILESDQLNTAQGAWLSEASSLFSQLGGAVNGPGSSTSTTAATSTP
jgi:hypothetical protein